MLTTSFGHSIRRNQHCINLMSHFGSAVSFVQNQLQKYNIRDVCCQRNLQKSKILAKRNNFFKNLPGQTNYLSDWKKIDSYHCQDCAIFPVRVNMFLQVDTILPPSSNLYYACVYSKSSLFRDKGTWVSVSVPIVLKCENV